MTFLLASLIAPPLYASTQDDLAQTKKDMEAAQARQAEDALQAKKIESEMKALRIRLVQAADKLREGQQEADDAEEKLRILDAQLDTRNEALAAQRKKLAALVQAALSLSRMPPEAMAMMPGDLLQTMKAARALKMASEGIREQTESIGQEMAQLQELKQKVEGDRETLARKQAALDQERATLNQAVEERKNLQAKLGKRRRQETKTLAALAKKAQGLQQLLEAVEQENRRATSQVASDDAPPQGNKGHLRSFAAAKGRIRLPVGGELVQHFGAANHSGGASKGIAVSADASAPVVAPYDGEVVFAGPFLGYGQLLILRHSDDFHTLLAGLGRIDVSVGQFLLEGEPIGAMGNSESGNRLYVELRKSNQPVDPALWMNIK